MNDTNMIDSCPAHLPVQTLGLSNSVARSDTGVVIDSEPHLIRTCKSSLLFAPFTLAVQLFVLHSNKTVNMIPY